MQQASLCPHASDALRLRLPSFHSTPFIAMIPRTIEVPLQQEQVLEVVCDDLPSNSKELTDIFRQEGVALTYYCTLAVS